MLTWAGLIMLHGLKATVPADPIRSRNIKILSIWSLKFNKELTEGYR